MNFICGSILLLGTLVAAMIAIFVGANPPALAAAGLATMLGWRLIEPHHGAGDDSREPAPARARQHSAARVER